MKKGINSTKKHLPKGAVWALACLLVVGVSMALVYYWRVFYYLDARGVDAMPLFLGLVAIGLLCVGVVALSTKAKAFEGKAALFMAVCGVLFCFANPPLQTPDEAAHFLRSYSLSQGRFDFDAERLYPDDVAKLMESFPGAWVSAHTSQGLTTDTEGNEIVYSTAGYGLKQRGENGTVESIADGFADYFDGEPAQTKIGEPIFFMTISMLPQALGIFLVRIFGANALTCMYAARLANLAAYVVLCYFALKNCKRYKPVFLSFMLLPLSLYMAASVSYDATLLGFYYLVASFYCKDEITDKDIVVFFAAFVMMNIAKPYINLLWILLPLVLPKSAWKTRFKKWQVAAVSVATALALTRFFEWYGVAFRSNYPDFGRVSGGANMLEQLQFILQNPLRFLAVLAGTLYENNFYIGQMGTFGALDMPIAFINVASPFVLLFAAALSTHEKSSLKLKPALGLGTLSVAYIGAALSALYITWTPVGMVRVIGFQARYLLPAFLMLFVLLAALLSHVLEPRLVAGQKKPLNLTLGVSASFAVISAILLFQHYFIGPVYTIK